MRRALMTLLMAACAAEEPLPATGTVTTERFRSELLDQELILRIRTPPDTGDSLPLVVQLDPTFVGLQQFDHTVGLVSAHEAEGDWPAAVVVGVDYDDPFDRFRDYTPDEPPDPAFAGEGADVFYMVLRDEVLPHLDATLPVDPARRVIQGHSQGGVFSWYAAMRYEPGQPPLFAGHVAADNGYGQWLFTMERWLSERSDDLPLRLYASRATLNGPGHQLTFDGLLERLAERDYPSLALETAVMDTDHEGVMVPSFEAGLDWTLGVWR